MLLENFLITNNITYTFFRSMGSINDCSVVLGSFSDLDIPKTAFTNHLNWFSFAETRYAFTGPSWHHLINSGIKRDWALSPTDHHPNLKAINEISHRLADFIRPLPT
jgi:hypothetical protein